MRSTGPIGFAMLRSGIVGNPQRTPTYASGCRRGIGPRLARTVTQYRMRLSFDLGGRFAAPGLIPGRRVSLASSPQPPIDSPVLQF